MESGDVNIIKSSSDPAAWFWILFIILVLGGIFAFLVFGVNVSEVSQNWGKYRCSPTVIPFASLYGYNAADNFNYCVQNILKSNVGQFTGPFGSILGSFVSSLMIIIQSVNSFRVMLATIIGGVSKTFQEIVQRFNILMQQINVATVRLKNLMGRMFAVFNSIMYMATSGITAGQNFSHTFLFTFLDTFCFSPETLINVKKKGRIPINDIELGDILLTGQIVTAKYKIMADGQPMVTLPGLKQVIHVSSNHYIQHESKWIRCEDHPLAQKASAWNGGINRPLICIDTDNHTIEMDGYILSDYQETELTDKPTMDFVDSILSVPYTGPVLDIRYTPGIVETELVKIHDGTFISAKDIKLHDILSTGIVYGIVEREQDDIYELHGSKISASTLYWNPNKSRWVRVFTSPDSKKIIGSYKVVNFLVLNTACIELKNIMIRDLMEIHSPDCELPTQKAMVI